MINIIPDWLQNAVNFINEKFPDDENVNMSIMYGYDSVGHKDDLGFALYDTDTKSIFLADYHELEVSFSEIMTWQDIRDITITNLFHEYRHHQQNIKNLDMDEDDAEQFANIMYDTYLQCKKE